MPGTLNVGGHDIITHSGDAGAGDVTVNVQNRLVLDSSGNVGIGSANPGTKLAVATSTSATAISVSNSSATSEWQQAGNDLFISNYQASGSAIFRTNGTERMRIDSSGRVLVGGISSEPSGGFGGYGFSAQNSSNCAAFKTTASANAGVSILSIRDTDGIQISFHQGGSYIGSITTNGSNTAFNTSSDYRLKENITEITDGITRVKQLNPSRFNFISDPDRTVDGFIAHEVSDVVPEAISGEKDAVNEDGSINPQGIDQSKLVPLLTAALQEAISKIEALTTRIEALENA